MTRRIARAIACNDGGPSKATSRRLELLREARCQRLGSAHRSASLGAPNATIDVASPAEGAALRPFPARLDRDPVCFCAESTQASRALGPPLFIVHCALLS